MNHFNATVHNGELVSTRRGMQVSKTKHQGTRFVNTFAAPDSSASASTPSASSSANNPSFSVQRQDGASQFQLASRPQQQQPAQGRKIKFVTKSQEKAKGATRGRPRRLPTPANTSSSGSESGEEQFLFKQLQLAFPEDSTSTPPMTPDEFMASYSPNITYSPEQWKSHRFGHSLPELSQKLVHLYLHHAPRQLYPGEHLLTYNPVRNPYLFSRINTDMISMQSVFMTSALMECIRKGDASFENLNLYVTAVCGKLKERLMNEAGQAEPAVLETIAAMAITGMFMDRADLWHVHMKGLRYVVGQTGGLSSDLGHVLTKIRRADINGAAYAGDSPYLDFPRLFAPISDSLSPTAKATIGRDIQRILQHCGIAQVIIDSIRSLALFTNALGSARHHGTPGAIRFDPESFSEELLWAEYQLVRYPGPLRNHTLELDNDYAEQYPSPRRETTPSGYEQSYDGPYADSETRAMFLRGRDVVPSEASNILDPVLRSAGILYVEELLIKPHSLNPYNVQLALLNQQIRDIVFRLREREAAFLASTSPTPDDFPFDGLPRDTAVLRPVLLWVCMVVYTVAQIIEANATFYMQPIDRAPYQDCVALLLGATSPADVSRLPPSDFALAKILPLRELEALGLEDEEVLKQITSDYEARQMVAIAPFL